MDTQSVVQVDNSTRLIVTDLGVRRMFVSAIQDYDTANGVLKSQAAKNDKPIWYFLCACLTSVDRKRSITEIVTRLKSHNIRVTDAQINRAIKVLTNKDASIHPHRRNIGISAYDLVTEMGDIKFSERSSGKCGRPDRLYYVGGAKKQVNRVKRYRDISLKP